MTTPIHTSSIALMEPPPDVSTLRELEAAVIIGDNDRVLCFLAQAQPMDAFVRKRHARQLLRIALSVNNKELAQALVRFLDPRDLLCRYRGGGTAL